MRSRQGETDLFATRQDVPNGETLLYQECGGCILAQMQSDPQSMSILGTADNVVEVAGWIEVIAAGAVIAPSAYAAAGEGYVTAQSYMYSVAAASPIIGQVIEDITIGYAKQSAPSLGPPSNALQWLGYGLNILDDLIGFD